MVPMPGVGVNLGSLRRPILNSATTDPLSAAFQIEIQGTVGILQLARRYKTYLYGTACMKACECTRVSFATICTPIITFTTKSNIYTQDNSKIRT